MWIIWRLLFIDDFFQFGYGPKLSQLLDEYYIPDKKLFSQLKYSEYIEDIIEIDLPIDDYDTLSGFILDLLGRFPEENEHIEVEYNHYKFEVLEYNDNVIEKIKISKLINEESEENDEWSLKFDFNIYWYSLF